MNDRIYEILGEKDLNESQYQILNDLILLFETLGSLVPQIENIEKRQRLSMMWVAMSNEILEYQRQSDKKVKSQIEKITQVKYFIEEFINGVEERQQTLLPRDYERARKTAKSLTLMLKNLQDLETILKGLLRYDKKAYKIRKK